MKSGIIQSDLCMNKFTIIIIGLSLLLLVNPVHAAKKRARAITAPTAKKTAVKGVAYSSASLNRPAHSVVFNLFNLDKVNKVSYMLSYSANGVEQGAAGSITPTGNSDNRSLYFGTCSHGVCTPHANIKNASLTITVTLKNGGTYAKRYRLKV